MLGVILLSYIVVIFPTFVLIYIHETCRHKGILESDEILMASFGMAVFWPVTFFVIFLIQNERISNRRVKNA